MVSSSSSGSTSVWDFFTVTEPGKKAKCGVCSLCLPLVKGSTNGLRHHLQWAHKMVIEDDPEVESVTKTVKCEPTEEKTTKCQVFAGKPADLIYQYLNNSLGSAMDGTSDVRIQCSDGALSAHKLVLASISKMLYEEFKENDCDETISLMMPEYTVSDVSMYLKNIYKNRPGKNKSGIPNLHQTFGHKDSGGVLQREKKISTIGTQTDEVLEPIREPRLDELMFQDDDDWFQDAMDSGEASTTGPDGVVTIKFMIKETPADGVGRPGRMKEGGRTNVSFVWDHFTRIDHERRTCNHCAETLTVSKGSTWKLRTHIIKEHKDILSEDYKNYLKREHNVDIDNPEYNSMSSENVLDPETGEIAKKKRKVNKIKKQFDDVWEYFKVDPVNPDQTICKICGVHTDNHERVMSDHLYSAHDTIKGTDDTNLLCSHCGLTFEDKATRNKHEGQHKNFQFWCDYSNCNKGFETKEKLDNHIRKHTGEKPFVCDLCSKPFSTKGALKGHMRKHSTDKPYQCNICGKAFGNRGSLKTHIRVHSDDLPYECEKCNQRFKFPIIRFQHKCPGRNNSPYFSTNDSYSQVL